MICPLQNILAEYQNKPIDYYDELLVKFKNSQNIYKIGIAQKEQFDFILKSYQNEKEVEYAEPNVKYHSSIIPSDLYYGNQWYLQKIKAAEAWDVIRESPDITIAIIDSGVQINHPDLKDNIWSNPKEIKGNKIDDDNNGYIDDINGWDFIKDNPDPSPKFETGFTEGGIIHGTLVSGIAGASGNNAAGITGITWRTKIMPLKVLDDQGEGNTYNVIRAIEYAIKNKADIINFSFTGFDFSISLYNAIKKAKDAGIIMVAAAGNEQSQVEGYNLNNLPMYPACNDGENGENWVIGVAATDSLDQKASFSSYGHKCVDISAPGVSIFSTVVYSPTNYINGKPLNKYYDGFWAGTSMATPMVSAALALIEQVNPSLNRKEVINYLLDNADNINRLNQNYLNQLGRGRLNLFAIVSSAKNELTKINTGILTVSGAGMPVQVKIINQDNKMTFSFYPYTDKFINGGIVASGDLDGDHIGEIITAPMNGGGPQIKIFSSKGQLKGQFFAYNQTFKGGVNLASGDVDGDGQDEIITAPMNGGGPHIKIFNSKGQLKGQFFAFDKTFKSGVNISAGDVDGNGKDEIIVAPMAGTPLVKIFNNKGVLSGQFLAFSPNFKGGVNLACGDIDGGTRNNADEIIVGAGKNGSPQIRVFDNKANVKLQFYGYKENFKGGINVAAGDINADGLDEIITAAGPSGAPHIKVFKSDKNLITSFYAYNQDFIGGVKAASLIDINK